MITKADLLNRFPGLVRIIAAKMRYLQYRRYDGMSITDVFEDIYAKRSWGSNESVSGRGSEMGRTEIVRKELPKVIDTIGARSLLDIPCGDFNWMKAADLSKIERYIGADIVERLIHSNQQNHGRHGVEFRLLDITSGPLPKVDLILCRDLLIHLSDADIWKSLKAIKDSNSKYISLTTYRNLDTNYDITTGALHRINLERPPYNFQIALRYIEENGRIGARKSLGLWRVSDLPVQ